MRFSSLFRRLPPKKPSAPVLVAAGTAIIVASSAIDKEVSCDIESFAAGLNVGSRRELAVNYCHSKPERHNSFKIMQYNILARDYTHYFHTRDYNLHGFIDPIRSGQGKYSMESEQQTRERYSHVVTSIIGEAPDVVCLQEVDGSFFDASPGSLSPRAADLSELYFHFHENSKCNPVGAAVLVRKAGGFQLSQEAVIKIPGSKLSGGGSKSAVAVPLQSSSSDLSVWVVSAHLAYSPQPRCNLMQQIELEIGKRKQSSPPCPSEVIFCADFNTMPAALPYTIENSFLSHFKMNLLAPDDITSDMTGAGNKW
jgi:endonuclease/exonuclease/phosphatase family metal-dependent hydrolase